MMTITNKIRFIQQKYWQLLKDYRAYRLSIKIEEYYYQESDKLSEINFQRLANQYNIPDAKYADFITNDVKTELWMGVENDIEKAHRLTTFPYSTSHFRLGGLSLKDQFYFWVRLG